jgi:hypothetical protein
MAIELGTCSQVHNCIDSNILPPSIFRNGCPSNFSMFFTQRVSSNFSMHLSLSYSTLVQHFFSPLLTQRHDCYSVKSAYHLLLLDKEQYRRAHRETNTASSTNDGNPLWRWIGKLNVSSKVRVFWWRIIQYSSLHITYCCQIWNNIVEHRGRPTPPRLQMMVTRYGGGYENSMCRTSFPVAHHSRFKSTYHLLLSNMEQYHRAHGDQHLLVYK